MEPHSITTAESLRAVPADLFDRAWKYIEMCQDSEKHFNDLQSRYRMMASTWLLAAFGAIGFVYSANLAWAVSRDTIAVFICLAGAVGIFLLWIVDVLVYHDLLMLSYSAGAQLEEAFPWLPPVRTRFGKPRDTPRVRTCIGAFYYVSLSALCLLALWLGILADRGWLLVAAPIGTGAVLAFAIIRLTRGTFAWKRKIPRWIEGSTTPTKPRSAERVHDRAAAARPEEQ